MSEYYGLGSPPNEEAMSEPQPIPVRETPEYREGWRKAVEQCARVAETVLQEGDYFNEGNTIAAAIRALSHDG